MTRVHEAVVSSCPSAFAAGFGPSVASDSSGPVIQKVRQSAKLVSEPLAICFRMNARRSAKEWWGRTRRSGGKTNTFIANCSTCFKLQGGENKGSDDFEIKFPFPPVQIYCTRTCREQTDQRKTKLRRQRQECCINKESTAHEVLSNHIVLNSFNRRNTCRNSRLLSNCSHQVSSNFYQTRWVSLCW